MKKTLTLLFLIVSSASLFAQKTIDVSLDAIVSPTELLSDASTGTAIPIKFACKNNGTDIIEIGDTLFWSALVLDIATSNLILEIPQSASSGNGYLTVASKQVAVGDTIHVGNNFNTGSIVTQSRAIRFGGICSAWNRTDGVTDPDTDNNSNFADITWYNQYQNGVSVADVEYDNNIAVYPNPASEELNIKLLLTQFADVQIEILDLAGKIILSENVSSSITNNNYVIDVNSVPNGMYIVKVTNGENVSTSKISIAH
ncbi:MAG: T9SS type A sorting domain-containing protein [Bacteroidia bacterium]|nr:T9SS type A sorting domain-containing protein [Bacteroidia bacterium]NNJ54551.1 T9SS type A sorting domain-containing protein [Bacteroidia bacterium]